MNPTPQLLDVSQARVWLIHWPGIDPTLKRYQEPVTLARVLSEHHAAIAAEPAANWATDIAR